MKSISTIEQPILFFQKCLNLIYIEQLKQQFYNGFINSHKYGFDLAPFTINYDEESVDSFSNIDEKGNFIMMKYFFVKQIEAELRYNSQISKELIAKAIQNCQNPMAFLEITLNELNTLENKIPNQLFDKYPIIKQTINDLKKHIQSKLGINLNNKTTPTNNETDTKTEKQEIVDDVFNTLYIKLYMNEKEYERLISYLYKFVEKYEVPNILRKFDILSKSKNKFGKLDLYHLFQSLFTKLSINHEAYTHKDSFSQFIITAFNGISYTNPRELSKHLGDKERNSMKRKNK